MFWSRKQDQICVIFQQHKAENRNNKEYNSIRRGCCAQLEIQEHIPVLRSSSQITQDPLVNVTAGDTFCIFCKENNAEIFPCHSNKVDALTLIILRINSGTALKQANNFFFFKRLVLWDALHYWRSPKRIIHLTHIPKIHSQSSRKAFMWNTSTPVIIFYLEMAPFVESWLNQWVLWKIKNEAVVKGSSVWERMEFIILKSKMLDTLTVFSLQKETENFKLMGKSRACKVPSLLEFSCTRKNTI